MQEAEIPITDVSQIVFEKELELFRLRRVVGGLQRECERLRGQVEQLNKGEKAEAKNAKGK
jgi:hypothetical protein